MLSFDELDDSEASGNKNEDAFFTLPVEEKDEASMKRVHDWLISEKNFLLEANRHRFITIRKNLALNKGIQYQDQDVRNSARDTTDKKNFEVKKIVNNKLKESNRTRASKLLKYKPNVAILPNNDELGDKVAAEMTKNLLEHIWYEQRFDGEKLPKVITRKGPAGECYLEVTWDPTLGDLHQTYKKAQKLQKEHKLEQVPLLGEDGKPEKDENGKTIYVNKAVRNGDVKYTIVNALDLLIDRHPSNEWDQARHSMRREVLTVEEARIRYPDGAKNIQADKEIKIYDYEDMQSTSRRNCVELWHFYHRRTDYMEKGRYIVFSSKGIIASTEFPYTHRDLPYVRWFDHENEGEMHAVSFFEDCKGIFGAFNNLTNMMLRNEILVGHPKWMMPRNAADIKDLGNTITVVEYKGPTPPTLVQANPTGAGAYNLRNTLKEEGAQAADVSRVGNGEPPQGITAAVAMQYLSELEQERWNVQVLNHNEAILKLSQMTLGVAGDYYDESDERMIRIQGQDGEWMSEFFNVANLNKDYDIRVQGASALPETKAARTETLLTLAEKFPDRVDPEQVLDMFDLAQNKKFIKEGTVSLRAAEAENEMILRGDASAPPEEYEDHVVHWKAHIKQMREWSFKNKSSPKVREDMENHIMAHEMMMLDLLSKSPVFAEAISSLVGFPVFFKPEIPPVPTPEEMAEPVAPAEPLEPGPMPMPEELPQEITSELNQEPLPPVDQQMGLEQGPVQPI